MLFKTLLFQSAKKLLIGLLFIILTASQSQAQDINALKAAYVYYFSKFISWENSNRYNTEYVNICFKHDDPAVAKQFGSLKDKPIGTAVLKIYDLDEHQLEYLECHIIYAEQLADHFNIGQQDLLREGLLIVSNEDQQGADIQFKVKDNKLRFKINQDNIEKKKLKVSSRLLRLADRVNR